MKKCFYGYSHLTTGPSYNPKCTMCIVLIEQRRVFAFKMLFLPPIVDLRLNCDLHQMRWTDPDKFGHLIGDSSLFLKEKKLQPKCICWAKEMYHTIKSWSSKPGFHIMRRKFDWKSYRKLVCVKVEVDDGTFPAASFIIVGPSLPPQTIFELA